MKKDQDLSRRNFLKGSVLGAGALTVGIGAGLVMPGTAHAAVLSLPLPYCRDSLGNPTNTPAGTNTAVLDVDDVRLKTWWHYNNGKG